jgi:protein-L-isoaspartate(D-aspartate) O-methyltransferase
MMLGALKLEGSERVLDLASGSAYQAALLGRLAREVISLHTDAEIAASSASLLKELGCENVRVVYADTACGWPAGAPYQAILVGAAATELPTELVNQLETGGRLVIALGDEDAQLLECLHKNVDSVASTTIGACHLDMLSSRHRTSSSFPWASHGKDKSRR